MQGFLVRSPDGIRTHATALRGPVQAQITSSWKAVGRLKNHAKALVPHRFQPSARPSFSVVSFRWFSSSCAPSAPPDQILC